MKALVLTLLLVMALVAPALAADYHVSMTGNDTNPGTAAFPFRTVPHAWSVWHLGDRVIVHAGNYDFLTLSAIPTIPAGDGPVTLNFPSKSVPLDAATSFYQPFPTTSDFQVALRIPPGTIKTVSFQYRKTNTSTNATCLVNRDTKPQVVVR